MPLFLPSTLKISSLQPSFEAVQPGLCLTWSKNPEDSFSHDVTQISIYFRGVVQLFNAVRKQQKTVDDELEMAGSDRKKEKVMEKITKHKFLNMLKGSSNVQTEKKDSKEKVMEPEQDYHKSSELSHTQNNSVITLKLEQNDLTVEQSLQEMQTEWPAVQTWFRLLCYSLLDQYVFMSLLLNADV